MHIPFDVSASSMARNFFAINSSSLTSASLISSVKSILRFFNFLELLTHASDADRLIVATVDDGVFSTLASADGVVVVVLVVVVTLVSSDFDDFNVATVSESVSLVFVWLNTPLVAVVIVPLDSHSLEDCDDPHAEYADAVDTKLSNLLNVHSEFG